MFLQDFQSKSTRKHKKHINLLKNHVFTIKTQEKHKTHTKPTKKHAEPSKVHSGTQKNVPPITFNIPL